MHSLSQESVLLKDFKDHALSVTDRIRRATKRIAETAGQTVR